MMNVKQTWWMLVTAAAMAACSSDSTGTGSGATTGDGGTGSTGTGSSSCSPTSGGSSDAKCDAYTACFQSKCDSSYVACFGSGYKSGNFSGGSCAAYSTCVAQCKCGDPTYASCNQGCYGSADSTCTSCLGTLANCGQTNCSAELNECAGLGDAGTSPGTGGGSGTTHTCADLAACCPTISSTYKESCDEAVAQKYDGACNAVYAPFGCK